MAYIKRLMSKGRLKLKGKSNKSVTNNTFRLCEGTTDSFEDDIKLYKDKGICKHRFVFASKTKNVQQGIYFPISQYSVYCAVCANKFMGISGLGAEKIYHSRRKGGTFNWLI